MGKLILHVKQTGFHEDTDRWGDRTIARRYQTRCEDYLHVNITPGEVRTLQLPPNGITRSVADLLQLTIRYGIHATPWTIELVHNAMVAIKERRLPQDNRWHIENLHHTDWRDGSSRMYGRLKWRIVEPEFPPPHYLVLNQLNAAIAATTEDEVYDILMDARRELMLDMLGRKL